MNRTNGRAKQSRGNHWGLSRSEMLKMHKRVVAQLRKMTPKQGVQSLIDSGILTPAGKLSKKYGG